MSRLQRAVDTRSEQWEVCLHEMGHVAVARALGWTGHTVRMRRTWSGQWEAYYDGNPPGRAREDELALQRAAVALGGPEVTRRRTWLWLPANCDGYATASRVNPELHLHDLRHTGGTLAAQTGATLKEIMARIGHGSTRAAMIYQHATSERDRRIAHALNLMIEEAKAAGEDAAAGGADG